MMYIIFAFIYSGLLLYNVKIISNTLVGAIEYITYFIMIFLVLIFGFVGMSYLSFGTQFGGYDTLKSSLKMNF